MPVRSNRGLDLSSCHTFSLDLANPQAHRWLVNALRGRCSAGGAQGANTLALAPNRCPCGMDTRLKDLEARDP